jgi:hypothetical protein
VLLSTPLSAAAIVIGKGLGNVYALRWLLALFAALWILAGILLPYCWLLGLLTASVLVALAPFFTSMGLFFSLRSRSSTRAMVASLLLSVLLGGAYLLGIIPFVQGSLDRGDNQFFWSPCAPMLVFWPGLYEPRLHPHWEVSPDVFVLGVSLYLVAGIVLLCVNILKFDSWAGRTAMRPKPELIPSADQVPNTIARSAMPFASMPSES